MPGQDRRRPPRHPPPPTSRSAHPAREGHATGADVSRESLETAGPRSQGGSACKRMPRVRRQGLDRDPRARLDHRSHRVAGVNGLGGLGGSPLASRPLQVFVVFARFVVFVIFVSISVSFAISNIFASRLYYQCNQEPRCFSPLFRATLCRDSGRQSTTTARTYRNHSGGGRSFRKGSRTGEHHADTRAPREKVRRAMKRLGVTGRPAAH